MNGNPISVLLVDDDEDDFIITRDLAGQIRDREYRIEWAATYAAGLEAARHGKHDICLLDYRLGEFTGLDLLKQARQSGCTAPIILLTGQGDHEVDVEAMKAGAADYLVKGQLSPDTLDRAIRYAIEGKQAEENLRRERDLISRIMETSPVGIVVADSSGRVTFANQKAELVLGLSRTGHAPRTGNVLEWQSTDTDGNPLVGQPSPLKPVLDEGRPVQNVRLSIPRNSSRVLLSTNATPLWDGAGNVDGLVVTVEDITERLSLEAQLRQSQKMESVGQLAAGIAHDINNVLTVIQGHAGILLNVTPSCSNLEKSLKQISLAAERAASFIKQLLLFSRKQVFQTKTLDLHQVLHNVQSMLSRMLGEDIALETDYRAVDASIEADTGMLEQVIMNLAVNARDAMPKGGRLRLTTEGVSLDDRYLLHHAEARPGDFVCLTVSDTGCGMDAKTLRRIFEPFFSTKAVGRGTGLGLATVYGIVKQHHGWVEVESQVGRGTTFRIFFPMAKTGETVFFPLPANTGPVRGGKESILVVEDEPGLREIVQEILREYHYHVVAAASGSEAMRIWDEYDGKFDLLLTDVIMPGGVNGLDLADHLRRRKPDLRIIYTSGYSAELTGKNLRHNNLCFLPKPYQPSQLARKVRSCLDTPLAVDKPLAV